MQAFFFDFTTKDLKHNNLYGGTRALTKIRNQHDTMRGKEHWSVLLFVLV